MDARRGHDPDDLAPVTRGRGHTQRCSGTGAEMRCISRAPDHTIRYASLVPFATRYGTVMALPPLITPLEYWESLPDPQGPSHLTPLRQHPKNGDRAILLGPAPTP